MMDSPYPVLEERPLPAVPRRFMRGGRRDLGQLPEWRLGCVFVFHAGHNRIALREHAHLTGTEEAVVDAVAVSVVDVRPRAIIAQLVLPSASAADDFTVRASFRCQVTEPEVVAGHGAFDLGWQLERHLARDHKLLGLGASHSVERIAEVRELVDARVEAYWEYHPLELAGLSISFTSASVLTPTELRAHEQQMRDERWRQDLVKLTSTAEDAEIERMKGLIAGGSGALTALGLARKEIHSADAVRDARESEQLVTAHLTEAVRIMQDSGRLDYVGIDSTGLVAAWYQQLTGRAMPQQLVPQTGGGPEAIAANAEEEDSEPLDEADLDN